MKKWKIKNAIRKAIRRAALILAAVNIFGNMTLFSIYKLMELAGKIEYVPEYIEFQGYCASLAIITLYIAEQTLKEIIHSYTNQKETEEHGILQPNAEQKTQ